MEWIKKNIISLIGWFIIVVGGLIWGLIQKGAEVEFNERVSKIMTEKVKSRDFMSNVMASDYMKEYKIIEQKKTVTMMLNSNDSNRVKFSAKLSAKTGLTVDALVDSLAARVQEDVWTEEELVELIRKYNRRMITL